jgi:ligand-binding sensor domain-containing protein
MPHLRIHRRLSIVLLAGFCYPLPLARGQYAIDSWTTSNGLPQNSVSSVVQAPDGYLWFATFDGLVRFDGVHFTQFHLAMCYLKTGQEDLGQKTLDAALAKDPALRNTEQGW